MKSKKYVKGNPKKGLTPITSAWMHRLMENQSLLAKLFDRYGSPINMLHPETFSKNIGSFQRVFQSRNLKHQIYYARKANKARCFAKQAILSGIGVDTASYRELGQALDLGGTGENLVLTAAIKTKEQIELALQHGVPIILDNEDECSLVNRIANQMETMAKVGFRVSGFHFRDKKLYSRFGFDIDTIHHFLTTEIGSGKSFESLDYTGLHFHLDGYSIEQRSTAVLACIDLAKKLLNNGFTTAFIDMGGGILMNYLESKEEWENFIDVLKQQVLGQNEHLTFQGSGLGYFLLNGQLEGQLKTYPYFNEVHGMAFLEHLLDTQDSESGKKIFELLNELNIEIRIEPGRSLLDQCGITIAKVIHRKQDSKGQWLVGLEMNMSQMMSSSADFLLDPFVVYHNDPQDQNPVDVFFTGAYCLERDVLLKRKINLPRLPDIGDTVIFVNTAGYMMHFFETEAHLFDFSKNIIYHDTGDTISLNNFVDDDSASTSLKMEPIAY